MITTTHSHKHWTDEGGHVSFSPVETLPVRKLSEGVVQSLVGVHINDEELL